MLVAEINTKTPALNNYITVQIANKQPSFQSLNYNQHISKENKPISFRERGTAYLFNLIAAWVTALFCSIGLTSCVFRGANDNEKP